MTVFEIIESQQQGKENTPAWMVGEQLKEICAGDSHCAQLVLQDLDNKNMSIQHVANKIKEYADAQHKKNKGNCVCVPPNVAEGIIREFYGLPAAPEKQPNVRQAEVPELPLDDDIGSIFDLI